MIEIQDKAKRKKMTIKTKIKTKKRKRKINNPPKKMIWENQMRMWFPLTSIDNQAQELMMMMNKKSL